MMVQYFETELSECFDKAGALFHDRGFSFIAHLFKRPVWLKKTVVRLEFIFVSD